MTSPIPRSHIGTPIAEALPHPAITIHIGGPAHSASMAQHQRLVETALKRYGKHGQLNGHLGMKAKPMGHTTLGD